MQTFIQLPVNNQRHEKLATATRKLLATTAAQWMDSTQTLKSQIVASHSKPVINPMTYERAGHPHGRNSPDAGTGQLWA